MSVTAVEYHTDIAGGRSYASRNMAHVQHAYKAPGCTTSNMDWLSTLRQVRSDQLSKTRQRPKGTTSRSLPDLHTAAREGGPARSSLALVAAHPEGGYLTSSHTVSKYQNFANTRHLVSKYSPEELDWILHLRGSIHAEDPSAKWRRFHTRPQQSFDMMKENCSKDNEEYQRSHITPQDRRIDRRCNSIAIENIRADPMSFRRWEGCEGSNLNLWRHMTEDHRRGYKLRNAIKAETTIRGSSDDPNGARISDVRTDGCIVEMLGKKKWNGSQHHDALYQRPPNGDPKLYYLGQMRPGLERDEDSRRLRMTKQPRTDANIPEVRPSKKSGAHQP